MGSGPRLGAAAVVTGIGTSPAPWVTILAIGVTARTRRQKGTERASCERDAEFGRQDGDLEARRPWFAIGKASSPWAMLIWPWRRGGGPE